MLGLNATMSDPWNPIGSVDQHNAIDGMYRRGEINDTQAHSWDKLFCGRAREIEHSDSKPMPGWLRQANEESDHNEQTQFSERETAVKKSEEHLKHIDSLIASEGVE